VFIYQYGILIFILHLLLSVGLTTHRLAKYPTGHAPGGLPAIAALPLPLLSWGLCILLFVDAVTDSPEECGVDSCGMAAMAAAILAVLTLLAYVAGAIAAFATRAFMSRNKG